MPTYVALIPAAGTGSRVGEDRPKQYLPLLGQPMLRHAVQRLHGHPKIRAVYVVLATEDRWFSGYDWLRFADKLRPLRCGGASRAQSVLNGLNAMSGELAQDDWVLVHDAARPCLSDSMLDNLITQVGDDEVGGLLAMPVADTLKRGEKARVIGTEPREGLWQAQTPQMFRYGLLIRALRAADPAVVTDEASAVETLRLQPRLVSSDISNLKVTYPQDLALAELILKGSS